MYKPKDPEVTKKFPVVEIFKSIEGEGYRTGIPTTFVRFGQCNLKCGYCDTVYAEDREQWTWLTKEQIYIGILQLGLKRITFTGGEPLLNGIDFIAWFYKNVQEDYDINVETNGSLPVELAQGDHMWVTMDYKCHSSGMKDKMLVSNLANLRPNDVLKFVVATDRDLQDVIDVMIKYKPRCENIYLHPVFGQMDLQKLANFVVEHSYLNLRLGLQIHKIIWDPEKRGV